MMPDLRARLRAVAEKQNTEPAPGGDCRVIESRSPLSALGDIRKVAAADVGRLGYAGPWNPGEALFLDTETTGLRGAGTVAFLVGMGWVEGETFVVRQLLMRDYPEEEALLLGVAEMLPRFQTVVTFNGKSFDLPLLRDRFTMARLRDRWRELSHLDLLHTARRTWKLRLGRCNLGSLEEKVLGIEREGDLPGAEVPERFFQFLKTGNEALLEDVLRHNLQDIRTLAALLARLCQAYRQPEEQMSMLDVFSIGRALEKAGEGEMARRCFQVASVEGLSQQARLHLARSHRRAGNYAEAAQAYQGMIARGEGGIETCEALAVLQERWLKDLPAALGTTEKAIWRFAGGGFLQPADPEGMRRLERRRARLRRRLNTDTRKGETRDGISE